MDPRVFVASMNMRGKWASPPDVHGGLLIKVNVTSAQSKTSANRIAFSPMTPVDGGYKGFYCFENYWQAGKVYEYEDPKTKEWVKIDHEESLAWWRRQTRGRRRYERATRVSHADYGNGPIDYIPARKQVYVPEYEALIAKEIGRLKDQAKMATMVIYDFDGPREEDGEPQCLELTLDLLKEKINDPRHPFGHGYVVGASILGYGSKDYCM